MKHSWPWGTCSESGVQQSSMSENLTLNMSVLQQECNKSKPLGFQFQDQDSSSTQSTGGQSYLEVGSEQSAKPAERVWKVSSGHLQEVRILLCLLLNWITTNHLLMLHSLMLRHTLMAY